MANFILQNEGYGKPMSKESIQCKKHACFNFDTGKNVNTSAPTKLNYFPNQSFKIIKFKQKTNHVSGYFRANFVAILKALFASEFCDSYRLEEPVFD